jgi:hypothetical protein
LLIIALSAQSVTLVALSRPNHLGPILKVNLSPWPQFVTKPAADRQFVPRGCSLCVLSLLKALIPQNSTARHDDSTAQRDYKNSH